MSAIVAVITRTKDRPLLLRRAAQSIAAQTYPHLLWVVVNDGGDEAAVRAVLDECEVEPERIRFISNLDSLGMEAASNVGIRATESDFVVIHDDDDTLHPEFLETTIRFLESDSGQSYGGVATGVEYVSEEINGDKIVAHDRRPFMDWVDSVDFAEMLAQNMITSNSFLYRRSLFNDIGGYNEELPVLGDWFFNIEFLLHADIKILPQALSYYHHRDRTPKPEAEPYANSVIGGLDVHRENAARCRNALIRKYRSDGGVVGAVVAGYFAHAQRHPDERDGSLRGRAQGLEGVERDRAELDRLWLLSQLLEHAVNAKPVLGLGRKRALVDREASLVDLAHLAKKRRISIIAPANFDEVAYLQENPDVAAEINKGGFQSGYEHYILNGHLENRNRPSI